MKEYETPEMRIVRLTNNDVVRTADVISGPAPEPGDCNENPFDPECTPGGGYSA